MNERNRPILRTSSPLTATVRMDDLKLGQKILTTNPVNRNLVDVIVVRSLRLLGDDVDVNDDELMSSRNNLITVLV